MEPPAQPQYFFGPFVLDPVEKVLLRKGQPVPLPPKALETLLALVEKRGHILEKAELLNRVWPDTFVEEATLAQNIFTLRKALGDSLDGRQYIETLPKRGYRFVYPVGVSGGGAIPAIAARPQRRVGPWLAAISLVAVLLAGGYLAWRYSHPRLAPAAAGSAAPTKRLMLAVLPIANLNAESDNAYFSEGLTEEIITQLGQMQPQQLGVIAKTTAMRYADSHQSVQEIARELGVEYILLGSVRREGRRVRISVQLIRGQDQSYVWAQNYDRDLSHILALESELARDIAGKIPLGVAPLAAEQLARGNTDPDAYEAYLKGRYFLYKRNPQATRKALEYFQQAVQYDPNFALAYAAIGDCYFAGVGLTGHDAFVQAESLAQKALDIDQTIPGAHSTIAYARMHEFDWPAADREFRRALELDPAHPSGYYVEFLMSQGRFEETLAIAERGAREDPVAILAVHGLGMIYFYARRYDHALQAFRKALELDPNYYWSLLRRAQTKEQIGRIAEAAAEFEKLGPKAEVFLARAHALAGNTQSARQILSRILSDPNTTKEFTYEIALVYAGLKENDKALDWLERAYDDRSYHMIYIKIDPRLDPLRAHPRFQQLLRRVGLPP